MELPNSKSHKIYDTIYLRCVETFLNQANQIPYNTSACIILI